MSPLCNSMRRKKQGNHFYVAALFAGKPAARSFVVRSIDISFKILIVLGCIKVCIRVPE